MDYHPFILDKDVSFQFLDESNFPFQLKRSYPKGIVLSGGGAKAIAYAGVYRALENEFYSLNHVTHISGASAGAMTAMLIAMGFSADEFEKIVKHVNLKALFDRGLVRAKGIRAINFLDILLYFKIKQYLADIAPKNANDDIIYQSLSTKIAGYEKVLTLVYGREISFDAIEDIIHVSNDIQLATKLETLDEKLRQQFGKNYRISFNDVRQLRSIAPQSIKTRIKKLYVVITNQSRRQLDTISEDNKAFKSIAKMVQVSGAHPILFQPFIGSEGNKLADGGIVDNLPIQALLDAGIKANELWCFKACNASSYPKFIQNIKKQKANSLNFFERFLGGMLEYILGGNVFLQLVEQKNKARDFQHIGNLIVLNTGSLSSTNITPKDDVKLEVIASSERITYNFLSSRDLAVDNLMIALLLTNKTQLMEFSAKTLKNEILHQLVRNVLDIHKLVFEICDALKNIESLRKPAIKNQLHEDIKRLNSIIIEDAELEQCVYNIINLASGGMLESFTYAQDNMSTKNVTIDRQISLFAKLKSLLVQFLTSITNIFTHRFNQSPTSNEDNHFFKVNETAPPILLSDENTSINSLIVEFAR
jgi:VPS inhibitor protein D